jgi:hypothetical protein
MTDKVKNALVVAASVAASGNGSSSSSSQSTTSGSHPQGLPRQRSDERLLTGEAESKVRAAALARVPGGSIERVGTDADGHAAYEAHMPNASGDRVTVYVNSAFEVVSVESGP